MGKITKKPKKVLSTVSLTDEERGGTNGNTRRRAVRSTGSALNAQLPRLTLHPMFASATQHTRINALILAIQDAPEDELPGLLNAVPHWHWPRTDLHYWIKPLNRFDSILEEVCKSYNVTADNIQVNEFTPRTKELLLAILRFTRLLLENATNRKLYGSFDVSQIRMLLAVSLHVRDCSSTLVQKSERHRH